MIMRNVFIVQSLCSFVRITHINVYSFLFQTPPKIWNISCLESSGIYIKLKYKISKLEIAQQKQYNLNKNALHI